jgi:ribosomal protein S18 acetylase RimI-like enzyme
MDRVTDAPDGIARLGLRPETTEDDEFLLALYASTRAAEMALTNWTADQKHEFVRWQFELQRRHYRLHYADAAFDVLTLDDLPVGRRYALFRPNEIRLMEITIDPKCRGRGIGTRVVRNLLDDAQRLNVSVTLHVEPDNPALRLYQHLGFAVVEQRGVNLFLEWRPHC